MIDMFKYKWLRSKTGLQLLVLFALVFVLSTGALIYLAKSMVAQFGEYAASINEKNIRDQAKVFLRRITHEQAMKYESIFQKIADSSALIAAQATTLLAHPDIYGQTPLNQSDHLTLYEPNGMFSNDVEQATMVLYWGAASITAEINTMLNTLSHLDPILTAAQNHHPESVAAFIVTENAISRYAPNVHAVSKIPNAGVYDVRNSIWYKIAKPKNNKTYRTVWSSVYVDEAGNGLIATAVSPIIDATDRFLGVTGIDVALTSITNDILGNLRADPFGQMTGMFSFLIDGEGRIVAFPPEYLVVFGLSPDSARTLNPGDIIENSIFDSRLPEIIQTGRNIIENERQISSISLYDKPFLVSSHRIPATGWRLAVVVPESSLLSSVLETRYALGQVVRRMTAKFSIFSLTFLICTMMIIAAFSLKYLVKPLLRLSTAANKVKDGDLTVRIAKLRNDEIGSLTQTFNSMVAELQRSDKREKEYARILEQTLEDRTFEIQQKNLSLENTLKLLKKEIQERGLVEDLFRQSEEKYRDIFENCVEGISQTTPDGRFISVNPALARIFQYDSVNDMLSNVTNMSQQLYAVPAQREKLLQILNEKGQVTGFEVLMKRKDGTVFWASLSTRAVTDENGNLAYILGNIEDISERKTVEEITARAMRLAEEANRAKSDFLATMSHEIRTPISTIIGMTQLVLGTKLNQEQRKRLEITQKSSDHLLALIDNILDFSKIEAEKFELETHAFDLMRVITDALDIVRHQADEKGLSLIFVPGDVPRHLKGDSNRLRQIIVNIVGNAIKFTQTGGVSLSVGHAENAPSPSPENLVILMFNIKDTGIGIPHEKLDTIFESFTQLDGSYTRNYGGTGLGLAICSRLVSLMGGRIWAESSPCQGSEFFFTARFSYPSPLEIDAFERRDHASGDGFKMGRPLQRYHILLAEDYEVNRLVIVPLLEKQGHTVQVVENGADALAAVQRHDFDLVLMDVQMPVMDGLEATKRIRALSDPKKAHLPIIALTAHAVKGDREKFVAAGMNAYLSKPVKTEALRQTMNLVCEKRPVADAREKPVDFSYALELMGNDSHILHEVCKAILKRFPADVAELRAALSHHDYQTVSRIAHAVKSAAKSIGAGPLSTVAFDLEQSGKNGDFDQINGQIAVFINEINTVVSELTRMNAP